MVTQLHADLATCAFRFVYGFTPPPPPRPCSSAACTLTAPDFVLGERDHLKCPVQPTAAAPGPRHSSAQKRREGRGRSAPLCGAPHVVFLLFVPIDEGVEVLAAAFVKVLFW